MQFQHIGKCWNSWKQLFDTGEPSFPLKRAGVLCCTTMMIRFSTKKDSKKPISTQSQKEARKPTSWYRLFGNVYRASLVYFLTFHALHDQGFKWNWPNQTSHNESTASAVNNWRGRRGNRSRARGNINLLLLKGQHNRIKFCLIL